MPALAALEFYTAIGAGLGSQADPAHTIPADVRYEQHDNDHVAQALLGLRYKYLGAELGAVKLPAFHRHAAATHGDFSADMSQDITAHAFFARAVGWGPELWRVTPFVTLGMASVHASNHEYGSYTQCGITTPQDYAAGQTNRSLIAGAGLQARLTDHLRARLEYAHIPHGTDEMHTGNREYSYTTLSLGWRF